VRWVLAVDERGVPQGGLVDTADKDDPQRRFGVQRLVPARADRNFLANSSVAVTQAICVVARTPKVIASPFSV